MNRKLSIVLSFLLCAGSIMPLSAIAETTQQTGISEAYTPVRVAIVLDSSGSIDGSPDGSGPMSRIAAKNFISLLPKDGSEVSVFEYSNTTRRVKNLTPLDNAESWKNIGSDIISLDNYEGATAMLDAVQEAREYLEQNASPDDNTKNVIVLFTDGSETERMTKNTATDNKILQEVNKTLGDNSDVVVYSVAFDYQYDDGSHSISGENGNGYGKQILDKLCGDSSRVLIADGNANELSDKFESIIYEITHYPGSTENKDIIPSDGEIHEVIKSIPYGVAEANIRISCNTSDAVSQSNIKLISPSSEEVAFEALGNSSDSKYWYSVDSMGINLKIIEPEAGDWTIVVPTSIGNEDIYISFIPMYNISLETEIYFDGSTDISEATIGDTLKVQSTLYSNNVPVNSQEFFNNNNINAKAYISDSNGINQDISSMSIDEISTALSQLPNSMEIDMSLAGENYVASMPLTGETGVKLISVFIYSENFICYNEKVITVSDGGNIYITKNPEDKSLMNGETVNITSLADYCSSDKITLSLGDYDESVINASLNNGTLEVTGISKGNTDLTVLYTSNINGSVCSMNINFDVMNSAPAFKNSDITYSIAQGETLTVDITDEASDYENDPLTFSIESISDPDIITADISGSSLVIEGKEKGNGSFRLNVTDGDSYDTITVFVDVKEAFISKLLKILIPALAVIIIAVIVIILKKKSRKMYVDLKDIIIIYNGNQYFVINSMPLNVRFNANNVKLSEAAELVLTERKDTIFGMDDDIFSQIMQLLDGFKEISFKSLGNESKGCIMTGKSDKISLDGSLRGNEINEVLCNSVYKSIGLTYDNGVNSLKLNFYCGNSPNAGDDGFDFDDF